jgi:wobble nucleotide-excising tRNase
LEDTQILSEAYIDLVNKREVLVAQKEVARLKLDEETNKIPREYQKSINNYLEKFGAEFKIVDQRKVNPSGQAATEYKLMLRGVEINLGDNKTPEDVTSFQNTLSEGDKSTLAFCYFLARLEAEEKLSEKILVFDDPISSLDRFRRGWTRNILRVFGDRSKQLIVLSHDPAFLEEMAYNLRGTDFKCLEVRWDSDRNSSVLAPTTVDELNKNDHMRNLEKIRNFLKTRSGSPEDVKARLRHLCECYLRSKCPKSFARKDNLGNMIRLIRESLPGDEIYGERDRLTDYEVINDYSIEENHSQDGTHGKIDEVELMANCKTTFALIDEPIPQ